ncbi:hypothetical protein [Bradyrhizobium sp. CCGE-LA001]|uniref:hypothetical protein n=1 Tax=Bradyrhizobium sp. CCGE-LA001 TaxID=1223566 RepID=UPI0002AA9784|nr:hypothetical protein [Bradyrhizobium sp. CCGE-LA001]AMA55051.1 hypothetical protein BCCGELA001_01360 [Bradyrhizobium sp. CCGE-LA001]
MTVSMQEIDDACRRFVAFNEADGLAAAVDALPSLFNVKASAPTRRSQAFATTTMFRKSLNISDRVVLLACVQSIHGFGSASEKGFTGALEICERDHGNEIVAWISASEARHAAHLRDLLARCKHILESETTRQQGKTRRPSGVYG